ncbi:hypothetical protein N7463_010581 [Penicillium fimorum]|uniref:Uncharacterized protein n=1 Tax=Penicillium fimorum TaxID=1882269 RepID=A0A9W9XLJ0_9EURO|nr:hypothetical protein N7463_010581 [Penicillium fimorum]
MAGGVLWICGTSPMMVIFRQWHTCWSHKLVGKRLMALGTVYQEPWNRHIDRTFLQPLVKHVPIFRRILIPEVCCWELAGGFLGRGQDLLRRYRLQGRFSMEWSFFSC